MKVRQQMIKPILKKHITEELIANRKVRCRMSTLKNDIINKIDFEILNEIVIQDSLGLRTQYTIEMTYNGESYDFEFTDSVNAYRNSEPLHYDEVMECLLSDAAAYMNCSSIDDFQDEFGYERVSECLRVYEGCKKTAEAFQRIFTGEELDELLYD